MTGIVFLQTALAVKRLELLKEALPATRLATVFRDADSAPIRDYADGRSPRAIARALNAEGIRGPFGGTWSPSTINGNATRGTGILNNELYVGRLVWNRLRYSKNPNTGKRCSRLNPRGTWIIEPVPQLRIVTDEVWDRTKDRQKTLHRDTRPDRREPRAFWEQQRARALSR